MKRRTKQRIPSLSEKTNEVDLMYPPSFESERRYMCGFTYQGERYLVGGIKSGGMDKRQYRVTENGLEQLPDLTFGFNEGRCANINDEVR